MSAARSASQQSPQAARVVAGRQRRRPVRRTVQLRSNGVERPAQARRYWATLVEFMEHKNNCSYPTNRGEFSFEELNGITPDDIYKWMADKCFGTPDPQPEDLPLYARSTSLTYYKKALSYFMPNKGTPWTVTGEGAQGYGNPTRSIKVNNLIRAVRRKETRGVGVKSSADRAFTRDEFLQAIDLLATAGQPLDNLRHQAMMKFQNHLIGRSDDTAHVKKDGLKPSSQFPEYLTAKMRWSKNVYEERDCPDQILLPCMNPKFCPVLGLAIFLEKWCAGSGRSSQWLFAEGITGDSDPMDDQDKEALKCKNNYSRALTKVLKLEAFIRTVASGKLGTHSIRKFATTTCRSKGVSKDDTDYRARWKQNKRMQDKYTDMQLYWPDICAASKLCDGGVCLYRVKDGLGITDQWLANRICPNINASFETGVATVFAKALLWACYDPAMADQVPTEIRNDILRKVDLLGLELEEGENPIKKVEVIPSQEDGTISLDVVEYEEGQDPEVDGEGNPVGAATGIGRLSTQWRAAIYAKVSNTALKVTTMEQVQAAKFAALERENKQLKLMLRTLMVAPARIVNNGNTPQPPTARQGEPANPGRPATLQKNIQTLELLWDEYENGIGGRKPAREFTERERGANKHAYCRRKGFWECMERLIRRGCTVPTAIARIKRVYNDPEEHGTMTKLLRAIKKDERYGYGHHLLR